MKKEKSDKENNETMKSSAASPLLLQLLLMVAFCKAGKYHYWSIDKDTGGRISGADIGTVGTGWHIRDVGDVNGDGHADLIWQNDSGLVTVSSLRNGAIVDSYDLEVVDGDWRLAAVGDVDGDGTDDIVWQRRSNGLIHYWRMVGGNVQARVDVGAPNDAKWRLEAVCGFFNYFYFVHTDSHRVHGWYVSGDAANGFHIVTSYTRDIFTVTGEWHLRGCGELKESGNNDELIWQHDSGNIIIWRFSQLLLEGHTEIYEGIEIGNPGPSWKVVGAGDVNNDGVAEIVFQQY